MNPKTSKLTSLLGSASLLAMAGAASSQGQEVAQAQMAQAGPGEVPEQVLITGSLIRGTVAVGVPVTNVSPQDFAQTGSLTTADLFRTVPSALVTPGPVGTLANNDIGKQTRVNIRNLDPNDGTRSLLMVDGYRFPPQGEADCTIDPSIIPALALDRIDILVDGASASYGSDAVAGVVNIILKRNFDGAITQLRTSQANDKSNYQASQLWGRTWDGGDITLTYEWYDFSPILGSTRSQFRQDFTPWGLDNRVPLRSSIPGTISTGAPVNSTQNSLNPGTSVGGANALGRACINCFAIPKGTGANFNSSLNNGLGPTAPQSASTLNWTTFGTAANGGPTNSLGGTANEFDPYTIAWYDAAQQRNGIVMTVDQRLLPNVSFFGEGFYTNRRAQYLNPANLSPVSGSDLSVAVPTYNPYYPTGAPTNLRVNYNMGIEIPLMTSALEIADRYLGGLNIDLPAGWESRVFYSESFDNTKSRVDSVNANAVSAALGWTMPAGLPTGTAPAIASWTRPATIPYLNLFCDPTTFHCNSPATLDYITGHRNVTSNYWINQKGVNLDGPLFPVPAGDVKAAIGAEYTTESFLFTFYDNTSSATLVVPSLAASAHKEFWATFAQLNVPVIGEPNSIPLVRRVDIEASWRHDQYSDVGGTSNQKVAFNWTLSEDYGITLRGAWGTSFRAPTFAEQVALVKSAIAAQNSNLFPQAQSIASGVVTSGGCTFNTNSMADRLVNPGPGLVGWSGVVGQGGISGQTCGANAQPIGMSVLGAAGIAIDAGMRDYVNIAQKTVRPETAMNWAATIEFSPTAILRGLDVQATWYQVKINDALVNFANPNTTSVNDSTLGFSYIVPTDIAKAVIANPALVPAGYRQTAAQVIAGCSNNNTPTACGPFEDMVAALLANPRNPVPSAVQTSVVWINDGTTGNFGWLKLQGIDFNASYDVDVGDFGAFNAGIVGTYYLHQYKVNDVTAANPEAGIIQDQYHTTLGTLGGIPQVGVESLPQLRYRARLGWSNGPISVTGFMDYQGHFFSTQSAPPNVNFQCTTTGGTIGGGTLPCAISNYTDIEPSYYTFDLSFGYDTGDTPADFYLKHLNIQVVVQNIMDRRPAFEYRISTGAGNPATFDITKSLQGRTIGVILTKTW